MAGKIIAEGKKRNIQQNNIVSTNRDKILSNSDRSFKQ